MTTFSRWRYLASVCLSRCGVQLPPSRSASFSATMRSTSSRTSPRMGRNSGCGVPLLRNLRSSLLQPRQDSRAAMTVTAEAANARNPKARSRKFRVLASRRSREAQIVHEDDESERPISIEDGYGADVNVAAGQRHDALPGTPAACGFAGGGPDVLPEILAAELPGVVRRPRQQREVCRARRGRHDALIAGDLDEQVPQFGLADPCASAKPGPGGPRSRRVARAGSRPSRTSRAWSR